MQVRFVDTTLRDGSQSLWAMGMRTGMMEAVAEDMDRAGFASVEAPVTSLYMKKFVRDLKEDPWAMARMLARRMPRTVKSANCSSSLQAFERSSPVAVLKLFFSKLAEIGAMNRVNLFANTRDQVKVSFHWTFPLFRNLGVQIVVGLSYCPSPRHTDEYYAQKTREIAAFNPDAIYLKDQGGLLTVDRIRTLLPVIVQNAGGLPVELHSHCTTGLAPLVYLEALKLGASALHTAVPPLANGPSQPSVFNVAANARLMGFKTGIDEDVLRPVSERFMAFARQDRLPIGAPLEYDYAQFVHQVPGGVISNLKRQLAELRIAERLDEVLEETVQVRKDLGYPIMITPHSQFVVTQAAINVATGARYRHVIDEVILFAQGVYGEDAGCAFMDQNLKDRLLGSARARELEQLAAGQEHDVPLKKLRDRLGGPGVSDEEFLLRYIMKGEDEIAAMRAAGAPRKYLGAALPLLTLIRELGRHKQVRYVQVRRGSDSLVVQNQVSG
ncbi:MAG: hypothetical protein HYY28_14580 [Betaproteobacteria bacterium]|nr:hypothetical protein [Betaproteobacteria bacterium]